MSILAALKSLRPEAIIRTPSNGDSWTVEVKDGAITRWRDSATQPSAAELAAVVVPSLTNEVRRVSAYRAEADPLQLAALSRERRLGPTHLDTVAAWAKWSAKIAEIKARYPDAPG